MTATLIDKMAARVSVAMNGGRWDTHYTSAQKQVWRDRVAAIIGGSNE
jgi:hypothetical protein